MNISIEPFFNHGQQRIKINMPYNKQSIERVKEIEGREWDHFNKFWHIPYTTKSYGHLRRIFSLIKKKLIW